MARKPKKVWLVEHPTFRYKEDVKDLAETNRLQVVDARLGANFKPEYLTEKPPKLTLKPEYAKTKDGDVDFGSAEPVEPSKSKTGQGKKKDEDL